MNCLLRLVICLVSVGATRYGDYSSVKMPHYNMDYDSRESAQLSDDYKDHSLEAAPPLDYGYEKQSNGKTFDQEDEIWKTRSKQKKRLSFIDDRTDVERDEMIPKFEINRRFRKHRTRTKNNFERENRRYSNNEQDETSDVQIDYRNDNAKKRIPEDSRIDLGYSFFTEKVIRRKPRDRTTNRDDTDDNELRRKDSDTDDMDDQSDERQHVVEEISKSQIPDRRKSKHYPEYHEYFDMKRVNNIKNKLPSLLRQTKVESSATESPNTRPLQDMTYYRRINVEIAPPHTTENAETTENNNVTSKESDKSLNKTELSLAEKSRLSILRKALKKENVRNVTWTTKPPVLMLVTPKMQTIVMVEPKPEMRGREVFDDSSERVARAKMLMRHKLVAGARSIQDLTDNWDDMVCDYIDVSLLDSSGACGREVLDVALLFGVVILIC